MTDDEAPGHLARAKALADFLRPIAPAKAAELDRAVAEAEAGHRDAASIQIGIAFTLEKFDAAAWAAGQRRPTEVIEGRG